MMESFRNKYLQACTQLKLQPNETILHAIRESNKKKNQSKERNFFLDLSGCNLSINDSNALSKCFATDSLLEEYHFTDCLLCEESLGILLNALSFNKTVKIMDLKGNNLRSSSAELVGKMLKRTCLVELYLEWNSLGSWDTGIVAIAEGITLNQTLRVLDLSNNQISHEGGQIIANALKRNKQLRVLDMRWNNIGVIGGRAFLSALSHNKYIVNLELAGNNIPSDTMKAIATAVKRNVDYHTMYEEHHHKTQTMRQEIDQLQLEKSLQVSTLIDQLEHEKEMHSNLSQTTRDRLDQMQIAIEELKSENRLLHQKKYKQEEDLKAAKLEIRDLNKNVEVMKRDIQTKEEEFNERQNEIFHKSTNDKKECQAEILKRMDEIQTLTDDKRKLNQTLESQTKQLNSLKDLIKQNEEQFAMKNLSTIEKLNNEKDEMMANHTHQVKVLNEKLAKFANENERLEEDNARLKSNMVNDKLNFEEEMLKQMTKWKQEGILNSKKYDERIELLVKEKEDAHVQMRKLTMEYVETQTQLAACQKERDLYIRQTETQKQLLDQRDTEYRDESNRLKSEVDSQKRINAELKDKISNYETKVQDIRSRLNDTIAEKESEKMKFQETIKSKEEELRRIRDDEMRRANILESALQNYISSARASYKS